jgi:pilus assembly protein CpaB
MQLRTILIGAFALVFGISAAIGVFILGNAPKTEVKAEVVSVVVAAADISRGDTISAEMLSTKDWPKDAVPEGAITDAHEILDRTLTMSLMKGDLLVEAKLAPKGAGRGLAAVIAPGMRAFTVQIPNVATGVAGFVQPGNRVDVLLTMANQGTGDKDKTGGGSEITLLQNVEILAVDQRIDTSQEKKATDKDLRSVTLMVTPADAAKVDLGANRGTLHLVLRNPADQGVDYVEPVTVAGLHRNPSEKDEQPREATPPPPVVAKVEAPPPPRPKKRDQQIRTLRGTLLGSIVFPASADDADERQPEEPRPQPPEEPTTSPAVAEPPKPSIKDA